MYSDHIARMLPKVAAVAGILATSEHEPRSIGACPHAYPALVGFTRESSGNNVLVTYQTRWRVLAPFLEDASAEVSLWGFVNSIPAALDTIGTISVSGTSGSYPIADRMFRALDIVVQTQERVRLGEG